jgi:hypothetical protein
MDHHIMIRHHPDVNSPVPYQVVRMPDELILSEHETDTLRSWIHQANLAARGGHEDARRNAMAMALLIVLSAGKRQFGPGWAD